MNLDQLKEEARTDLIIENEEQLGSESLKNQKIKTKYLQNRHDREICVHEIVFYHACYITKI